MPHNERPQLRMKWPGERLDMPPPFTLPPGYGLRVYRPGDESRFVELMALAGWDDWDADKLDFWLARVLPDGWFMVTDERSKEIAATSMAVHNYRGTNPFQGEIGWIAADPAHTGRGLGRVVTAAATTRLIRAGYRNIQLYTEDFRLPALKVYLTVGYVPLLYLPEMAERWRVVCQKLGWPFTPEAWITPSAPYITD